MQEASSIDTKIVSENSRLLNDKQQLQRALDTERKKQEQEQKKQIDQQKKMQDSQERSRREHEIKMRNLNMGMIRHEQMHAQTAAQLEALAALPQKIVVAFFASDPGSSSSSRLALDEEARSIGEKIRASAHRDAVDLKTKWAVRPMDILQAINELNPTVIHFSGHGSDTDDLVLQDDKGNPKFVSKEAIVHTISVSSDTVKLVVFNTCFSFNQAHDVVTYIDAAIGMNKSIGDDAARIFSSQLYSAIGFGKSVNEAFRQAKAALMMEKPDEAETPQLYIREGVSDQELILVNPNTSS